MMEVATCGSGSRSLNSSSSWISDKFVIGSKTNRFLKFSKEDRRRIVCLNSIARRSSVSVVTVNPPPKFVDFQRSCVYKNAQASIVDQYTDYNHMDEALILKKKSQDIGPYLSGRCIYLVGMMGSGKSTVGKILAEVLGYSFLDSDNLVEQAVGATSVAQIFKQYSEGFFRDNESAVLGELSLMRRLVVATGGGAVIRPINWKYMKKGITVWLDVPLEALARRIAKVGTNSRPLLHNESGDAYTTAYKRLTVLSEERGEVYANADAKVCLQRIAQKLGLGDVSKLSPSAIAIEVLIQIEGFLEDEEDAETLERNF